MPPVTLEPPDVILLHTPWKVYGRTQFLKLVFLEGKYGSVYGRGMKMTMVMVVMAMLIIGTVVMLMVMLK